MFLFEILPWKAGFCFYCRSVRCEAGHFLSALWAAVFFKKREKKKQQRFMPSYSHTRGILASKMTILSPNFGFLLILFSSVTAVKRCLSRGGHLSFRILCYETRLGANQTGGYLKPSPKEFSKHTVVYDFWLPYMSVSLVDNSPDNICKPSCHHSGVEAQSGPGCHRKPQRCQAGSKYLLTVQNSAQQLPRGVCSVSASG